ncbi:zinc-ribbon domain-containing protein [Paenibacillus sp. SN-8-1]|uniref:zinc-ribbon domain-containing protein n=1 Tax=Paenibacillus sp. SN-8-1 TaxID=3435409 RepID=UPI003D9AAC72
MTKEVFRLSIKERFVEVTLHPKSAEHYEMCGYALPWRGNVLPREKMLVAVEHISRASDVRVTKVCDICGKEVSKQKYGAILYARRDGLDRCQDCARRESARLSGKKSGETKRRAAATKDHNLAAVCPDIASEWHPSLNGALSPCDFAPKSGRRAWWMCGVCAHEWSATIAQRTFSNTWCPICCGSKGEKEVRRLLEAMRIPFIEQVSFNGLLGLGGGHSLFDFGIVHQGKVVSLIEYDGIHHYRPIQKENPESIRDFQIRQEHDGRKNEWCNSKNIPLLRICYEDFSEMESIILDFIKREAGYVWGK